MPAMRHVRYAARRVRSICPVSRREGRVEPLLHAHPKLSSSAAYGCGVVLEDYAVPACGLPRHEHLHNFLHVELERSVRYDNRMRCSDGFQQMSGASMARKAAPTDCGGARYFEASRPVRGHAASRSAFLQRAAT